MERYFINKEIGSGSFGKVYQVEAKSTGIHYVAKVVDLSKLDGKHAKAAEKEIQVLSKLKHPNIVRYKEAYVDKTDLYIIMELCEMGDLHSLIQDTRQKNGSFSESETMQLFVQICLALNYTHRQRILHRDVKTKNIFLKKGNIVKLGDFGVAKVLENSLELAETCTGSPFYISPEICNNQPYDKKSDVWALGCVLFEMATLRYAFTGKSMKGLILNITTGDHAPLPANIAPNIRHLIRKLLTCNPKQRPTIESILTWPFVSAVGNKLHCKIRSGGPKRCLSGESLLEATSIKPLRNLLPVSKSCLNLCESSITEPHVKYKPIQPRQDKTNRINARETLPTRLNNYARNNISQERRRKNFPKSDSKYYSLIAGNSEEKRSCTVVHNIFETHGQKDAKDNNKEKSSEIIETKELSAEIISPSCFQEIERRKWEIGTADKRELVNLLSEARLIDTFGSNSEASDLSECPNGCAANRLLAGTPSAPSKTTIDDLLFSTTLELPNIPALEPEIINDETLHQGNNSSSSVGQHEIDEATFFIDSSSFSEYELIEKRRSVLEQCLGVKRFLEIYRFIEKSLGNKNRGAIENAEESIRLFKLTEEQFREICQLVEGDI